MRLLAGPERTAGPVRFGTREVIVSHPAASSHPTASGRPPTSSRPPAASRTPKPTASTPPRADWVARAADDAVAEHRSRGGDGVLVCASGISPSGPIHLGNLRELVTPHLVAVELADRGMPVEHVLFLDDHDRLRRLPAGVPARMAEHVGRPLAEVPDPYGTLPSWAHRYTAPLTDALARLGIAVRVVGQAERYRAGRYRDAVLTAMAQRRRIATILAEARGASTHPAAPERTDAPASDWPYRVYCRRCGHDDTRIVDYDEDSTALRYACTRCGDDGFRLADANHGKLTWKVDWPMRWATEPVAFEAAGADHAAPSSSFGVGRRLCAEVFGARPPALLGYGFVGVRGAAKLSSSGDAAPTPADALAILEPAMLRWLYARRRPQQPITVDFGTEVTRLYDEWDRVAARVAAGTAGAAETTAYRRAITASRPTGEPPTSTGSVSDTSDRTLDTSDRTVADPAAPERSLSSGPAGERVTSDEPRSAASGGLAAPRRVVPWRLLTSILDVTAGDPRATERILGRAGEADLRLADVEPRPTLAATWLARHVPPERRTRVRAEPDTALLAALTDRQRHGIALLVAELPGCPDLTALTALVYGIPKRLDGLPAEAPADESVRAAQRAYFTLLYRLLVGAETGPRLPTLLLALGPDRVRRLVTA